MTENEVIETFNRNLAEVGSLGARKAAAKEIAHNAKVQDRLLQSMAKLRLERERILQLWGELGRPKDLELAALNVALAIAQLDEERLRHA